MIARLPQEQQKDAFAAAFREDWRTKEKHAIPVRELAQWIRENVMLTLADAVFDCEDAELVPAAGACVTCPKRTGANTALFDDFAQDDRCMLCGIRGLFKALFGLKPVPSGNLVLRTSEREGRQQLLVCFRNAAFGKGFRSGKPAPLIVSMGRKTSFPPDGSILCPVFWVSLPGDQPFGRSLDVLVANEVVNAPEDNQNVVANQRTVLFRNTFLKAQHEPLQERVALWLARNPDLPQRLQAVAGGHKVLILRNSQQGCQILRHSLLGVASSQDWRAPGQRLSVAGCHHPAA